LLVRPEATVLREGERQTIPQDEVVLGDLLELDPGDQVLVDGEVVGDGVITVDESLLTGESDHVTKRAGDAVYSGSFCMTGSALYEAQAVGGDSLAHGMTAGARRFRTVMTPVQRQV